MDTSPQMKDPSAQKEAPPKKFGRRRFLGAGGAITPAILTILSQPALGATCFTPSRSLSRNTSVSQDGFYGECTGAQSPGNYAQQTSDGSPAFSWPAGITPSTPFHPTFAMGVRTGTRFQNNKGESLTMLEVLNLGGRDDPEKMAFHLLGAYLNCLGGGGSSISPLAMTPAGVLDIWAMWASNGYYEPTGGVRWGGTQIKNYLLENGIVK